MLHKNLRNPQKWLRRPLLPRIFQLVDERCFRRVQAQNISGPKSTDCWEFNPNIIERINDVIGLSKSVERFSKEAHLSIKDTSARDNFLAHCNSLVR